MRSAWLSKYSFALRWIGIAFLVKGLQFAIFAVLYYRNWPKELITNYIFVVSGDTTGYYTPVESFVNTGVYDSFCRMPGLLPIYAPLYYLFGALWGKTLVILLQFVTSTLSVYLLAQTAVYVFANKRLFYFTFFLYAFSSFISNWDHFGLSDSFGISFLIYAVYFAVRFRAGKSWKHLLVSGIFMAWSVFFRPVHGIVIPLLILLYMIDLKQLALSLRNCLIFCLPIVFSLGIWTLSNYKKYQRVIVLQGSMTECFEVLKPELLALRSLVIAWGGDYQPWSKGSEAEWFFRKYRTKVYKTAIKESYFTSKYNYDSLVALREDYYIRYADTTTESRKAGLSRHVIETAARYVDAYRQERPFSYYLGSKLKILRQLLIPDRLDNFPTPKLNEMNFFEVNLKRFYVLFFFFVTITGSLSALYYLFKRQYFVILPLALIFVIGIVLGFVEQRYLTPAFPFLVMLSAAVLTWIPVREQAGKK